jgi:hypothetical protein
MSAPAQPSTPAERDRAKARLRGVTRGAIVAATGATVAMGIVVSHDHPGASAVAAKATTSASSTGSASSDTSGSSTTTRTTGNSGTSSASSSSTSTPTTSSASPAVTSGGTSS